MKPGDLTPDNRRDIVNDVIKQLAIGKGINLNPKVSAEEQVVRRAGVKLERIKSQIREVVQAAHTAGHLYDSNRAYETTFNLIINEFKDWSKDDLLFLSSVVQACAVMEGIDEMHKQGLI